MDIASIANMAAALIAPYLAKAGETLANKAGEGAWKAAEGIYHAIQRKFTGDKDDYAQQTLQRLTEQPTNEARQAALSGILTEKAQADPAFAQELTQLVQNTTQTEGVNQFLTQVYDNARVGKILNIANAGDVTIN